MKSKKKVKEAEGIEERNNGFTKPFHLIVSNKNMTVFKILLQLNVHSTPRQIFWTGGLESLL